MRFGIALPPTSTRELAAAAEAAGFDSLWAGDRLLGGHALDPIGALHIAAGATTITALGTAVLAGPWYPPVLLARSLATLDHASAGRLTIGLGLGHGRAQFDAAGVPIRHRGARVDDLLDVCDAVWGPDPVTFTGARAQLSHAQVPPKPYHQTRPPILLSASTPSGLDRIARRADGWITRGLGPETIPPMWRAIRELAGGYGRDPDTLRLVVVSDIEDVDKLVTIAPHEIVLTADDSIPAGGLLERYTKARRRLLRLVDEGRVALASRELERLT